MFKQLYLLATTLLVLLSWMELMLEYLHYGNVVGGKYIQKKYSLNRDYLNINQQMMVGEIQIHIFYEQSFHPVT